MVEKWYEGAFQGVKISILNQEVVIWVFVVIIP